MYQNAEFRARFYLVNLSGMKRQEIYITVWTLIGAGVETTAALPCDFTWYLLRKLDCLAIIQHDVTAACEAKDNVKMLIVGELENVLAVVNEAFRTNPTALAGQPCRAPPEG